MKKLPLKYIPYFFWRGWGLTSLIVLYFAIHSSFSKDLYFWSFVLFPVIIISWSIFLFNRYLDINRGILTQGKLVKNEVQYVMFKGDNRAPDDEKLWFTYKLRSGKIVKSSIEGIEGNFSHLKNDLFEYLLYNPKQVSYMVFLDDLPKKVKTWILENRECVPPDPEGDTETQPRPIQEIDDKPWDYILYKDANNEQFISVFHEQGGVSLTVNFKLNATERNGIRTIPNYASNLAKLVRQNLTEYKHNRHIAGFSKWKCV